MLQVTTTTSEEMILEAAERQATSFEIRYAKDMKTVPASIKLLRSTLEELHMDNNYALATLPAAIGDLSRLRTLDASYCGLTSIAPDACRVAKLQRLLLSNNHLTSLPCEMWQLKSLQELLIDNNKLRVLPGGLLFLPNLRTVALENNDFYAPEDIAGAAQVTLVPPQRSVDCANCCARVRNYLVTISFHSLAGSAPVPFVFYSCSDECKRHLLTRLERVDQEQRDVRKMNAYKGTPYFS